MKGDRSRPAIIYLVRNLINGKRYLGVTCRALSRRASEHFCHALTKRNDGHFARAIRKHGRDVFEFEILEECRSCDEALRREIELIRELKPEYNSTEGGDGRRGGSFTEEGLKRISAFQKGKKWCFGKKHSEQTRQKLRDLGLANKEKWAVYAKLGPAAMSRSVVCLDDEAVFPSVRAAARHYEVECSALNELCNNKRGRKTVGGKRFAFAEVAS